MCLQTGMPETSYFHLLYIILISRTLGYGVAELLGRFIDLT